MRGLTLICLSSIPLAWLVVSASAQDGTIGEGLVKQIGDLNTRIDAEPVAFRVRRNYTDAEAKHPDRKGRRQLTGGFQDELGNSGFDFKKTEFIAPEAGLYLFELYYRIEKTGNDAALYLEKNAPNGVEIAAASNPGTNSRIHVSRTQLVRLQTGDRITIHFICRNSDGDIPWELSVVEWSGVLLQVTKKLSKP